MKGRRGCLLQVYTGPPAVESESVCLGATLIFEQPLAQDLWDGPSQVAKGGPRQSRAAEPVSALPDHMAAARICLSYIFFFTIFAWLIRAYRFKGYRKVGKTIISMFSFFLYLG